LAPDALQGFALPELFGQGRAVIRRVPPGTDQAGGAAAIDLADAVGRSLSGHPPPGHQGLIVRHGALLSLTQGQVVDHSALQQAGSGGQVRIETQRIYDGPQFSRPFSVPRFWMRCTPANRSRTYRTPRPLYAGVEWQGRRCRCPPGGSGPAPPHSPRHRAAAGRRPGRDRPMPSDVEQIAQQKFRIKVETADNARDIPRFLQARVPGNCLIVFDDRDLDGAAYYLLSKELRDWTMKRVTRWELARKFGRMRSP